MLLASRPPLPSHWVANNTPRSLVALCKNSKECLPFEGLLPPHFPTRLGGPIPNYFAIDSFVLTYFRSFLTLTPILSIALKHFAQISKRK